MGIANKNPATLYITGLAGLSIVQTYQKRTVLLLFIISKGVKLLQLSATSLCLLGKDEETDPSNIKSIEQNSVDGLA
ncbi:MAG: hypothetical protein ACOX8P_12690 [Tepidanaerobacteraceae bacterium]|mgnify:FL=1